MNGAEALARTLVDSGVDVCFMNPGTSEMHFVAALDAVPDLRGVLALFEGVATGAADGYARMAGRPAAVLLHLGPGLGNGLANLHNARRARTPMVVVVGDHATSHRGLDAPLESDIDTVARNVSSWIRTPEHPGEVGPATAEAVAAASEPPGRIATLVLPADASWGEGASAVPVPKAGSPRPVAADRVAAIAAALAGSGPAALLVGGSATTAEALVAADRVAGATGARLLSETFPARLARGGGLPTPEPVAYLAEMAEAQLAGLRHLVLVDAAAPVSFFAYPGRASRLVPDGCQVHALAEGAEDAPAALAALAEAVGAPPAGPTPATGPVPDRPAAPTGALDASSLAAAIAARLPEGAVVVDEAATSGVFLYGATAGAPRHDWLTLTGGAIGQGLPAAVGAAVACPDRPVLALQADGSALYTIQALWTMARENLDVTVVLLNNSAYAILGMELNRVGAVATGERARAMLDLRRPDLDFTRISEGLGVPATRATTADELVAQLDAALAGPGPHLIEAIVPPIF